MSEHYKASQFWRSESGALVVGSKEHGYFAVCSCGAELCIGPTTPYDVPKPARLEELQEKEVLTPEEEVENNILWEKWHAEFLASIEKSTALDQKRMREAIEKHAAAQSKEAVSA